MTVNGDFANIVLDFLYFLCYTRVQLECECMHSVLGHSVL